MDKIPIIVFDNLEFHLEGKLKIKLISFFLTKNKILCVILRTIKAFYYMDVRENKKFRSRFSTSLTLNIEMNDNIVNSIF